MFRFAHPIVLILIPTVLLSAILIARFRRPPTVKYAVHIPKEFRAWNTPLLGNILRISALCCFVLALARPQSGSSILNRSVSGVDIMLILDVSESMKIEDLAERSRIEIAKETLNSFIRGRANDRIGLGIFSGEALTLAPPTLDYAVVLKAVEAIEFGVLKQGTAIGDGLSLGVNTLKNVSTKSRVLVLLTDGDNNAGQVDPGTAGELAKSFGIRVYTIAIGREGRVRIPIDKRRGIYQWQDNALNTELIEKIAQQTGGKFYRATDEEALVEVFKDIDSLERTEIHTNERMRYHERFAWVLILGLALLLVELILTRVIFRGIVA